jgi:hypothetical protein
MFRLRALPLALLLPVLLVGASCKTSDSPPPDYGVSSVQFKDVEVPGDLKLIDNYQERSHSREEPGWRYGHYVYRGQMHVDDACQSLLLQMPQHAWRIVSDERPQEDTRHLRFARGRYVADCTLKRQDGVTEMVVEYRTEIEPK